MNGRQLAALAGQDSVVYTRRPFYDWLGTEARARLIDQLLFDGDKADGEWFSMTDAYLRDHLLLSRRDLKDARDHLVAGGLIEIQRGGAQCRMWYRIDCDAVAAAFNAFLSGREAASREARSAAPAPAAPEPASRQPAPASTNERAQTSVPDRARSIVLASEHKRAHQRAQTCTLSTIQVEEQVEEQVPEPSGACAGARASGSAKRPAKAAQAPKKPRERNELWDVFCEIWSLPDTGGRHRGLAGDFAARAKAQGASVDEARAYAEHLIAKGEFGTKVRVYHFPDSFLAWRKTVAGKSAADRAIAATAAGDWGWGT